MSEYTKPKESDIKMMVLAECHLSAKRIDSRMKKYISGKMSESPTEQYIGCSLINLHTTWEKILIAARCICSIQNPKTIYCVGQRTNAQRAILRFAKEIGAIASPGRFTPGQFTNQVTKSFVEPRLLIVADPKTDSQAIKEASYVNIPVIGFCSSDSPLTFVDIAIPGNNQGRESIGLLYWLLAREVKRVKAEIPRDDVESDRWAQDVPVDLFFYNDVEKKQSRGTLTQVEQEKETQENAYQEGYEQDYLPNSRNSETINWGSNPEVDWEASHVSQLDANENWDQTNLQKGLIQEDWTEEKKFSGSQNNKEPVDFQQKSNQYGGLNWDQ